MNIGSRFPGALNPGASYLSFAKSMRSTSARMGAASERRVPPTWMM